MKEPAWHRLGYASEHELASAILEKFEHGRLTNSELGRHFGLHPETIRRYCVRNDVARMTHSEATHRARTRDRADVVLSSLELETLDGLMLGDGHLDVSDGGWTARYTHGERHLETLASIRAALSSLRFSPPWSDGTYSFFKSLHYAQLVPVWRRWYGAGTQQIPADLKLTREVAYWFFLGDGYLAKGNYYLGLATHGFSDESRRVLRDQFTKLGMDTRVMANGSMYVCARSVPRFYELIGPCRNPEYSYKWDYTAPRYTYVRRHKSDIERDAREAARAKTLEELA